MTIAAISTPIGAGALGVIRISGEDAFVIADKVFVSVSGRKLTNMKGYTAAYGNIVENGENIDSCVALVFRAPNSYTGENVVELSVHGGTVAVKKTLRLVISAGAIPAGPGEFTRRAYLNGKMNLAEAESVMKIISAKGEQALRASKNSLDGALSKEIDEICSELTNISASLAIWTDSPDDEMFEPDMSSIEKRLIAGRDKLSRLLVNFENGKAVTEGISTVICGKPNVGKSTLMNMLAGCERSIVTDIAGTTRDIVEETVRVGDVILRLSDTAGLHDTQDVVESIGVDRTIKKMDSSDFIIAVFDSSEMPDEDDEKLAEYVKKRPHIAVFNKSDKKKSPSFWSFQQGFEHFVFISAKQNEGFDELSDRINEIFNTAGFDASAPVLVNERQYNCVSRASEILQSVCDDIHSGITADAVNVGIDEAIGVLLELTGRRASEDVVNEIFSKFCVGK